MRTGRTRARQQGVMLVEYVFAIGIGSLLLTSVALFAVHHAKSAAMQSKMIDMDEANRNVQAIMSRDFRQVLRLQSYTSNKLNFIDSDGATLQYIYNPQTRKLSRVKNGVSQELLSECESLNFSINQRNAIPGRFNYHPAASSERCKVVRVNWTCSREMFGQKANVSSSQSASIAIQNQ